MTPKISLIMIIRLSSVIAFFKNFFSANVPYFTESNALFKIFFEHFNILWLASADEESILRASSARDDRQKNHHFTGDKIMTATITESKLVALVRKTRIVVNTIGYIVGEAEVEENQSLAEYMGEIELILARHNVAEQIKSAASCAVEAARIGLEANLNAADDDDRAACIEDARTLCEVAERTIQRFAKTLD